LSEAGVAVYGVDPMLDDVEAFDLEGVSLSEMYESTFDGIVLVTPHEEFEQIAWDELGRNGGSVVIDGRDSLSLTETEHRVYTIGGMNDV
jgi:UDP-N-acetyl-D-mannosaminuronic acid dehydrogenase